MRLLPILFFIGCSLFFGSCSPEDEKAPVCQDPSNPSCPNFDPCYGIISTSAEFKMEVALNLGNQFIEENEAISPNTSVRFTATQDCEEYCWIIGLDTFFSKSITIDFCESCVRVGDLITIDLIVKNSLDSICRPGDNGMDTISKELLVKNRCDFLVNNQFFGAWDENPQDSFYIKLELFELPGSPSGNCTGLKIFNIDNSNYSNCNGFVVFPPLFTNHYLEFVNKNILWMECGTPEGFVRVDQNNKNVYMEYYLIQDKDGDGSMVGEEYDAFPKVFRGYVK